MMRSILFVAAAVVEGVQVQVKQHGPFGKPDTRQKCADYCKKCDCPKGYGCCTNKKKFKVTKKFKNPTVQNADACFNQGNIWCSQGGWTFKNSKKTCIPIDKPDEGGDPFDCRTREQWSAEKSAWCCANKNLGCTTTTTTADVGAEDDPHITNVIGEKFDLYKGGQYTLLTVPAEASHADADLQITGIVKRHGSRENDLWIRNLAISGKWVKAGYKFMTVDAPFNSEDSLLVRREGEKSWQPLDGFKDANLVVTSNLDKTAPASDFAQSVARKVEIKAGPVQILVDFATAQKEGDDVNHLDLHVKGLEGVKSSSGLLAAKK